MKKRIITILIICIILIILIVAYHFSKYNYYTFNFNTLKFPNANKTVKIIDIGGIDPIDFQILEYSNKDIKNIIEQDFNKIEINQINKIYQKAIEESLFNYLSDEEKEAFLENFNKEELFNTNNYYLFLEDAEDSVYKFMLFIIDVDENKLYYILGA